jgi:hypothetical protein
MRAGLIFFLLFAVVFGVALGAERLWVPDIVPIAFAEEPQPGWAVQLAFLLRTIELMAAAVSIIALAVMFGAWANSKLRHRPL